MVRSVQEPSMHLLISALQELMTAISLVFEAVLSARKITEVYTIIPS